MADSGGSDVAEATETLVDAYVEFPLAFLRCSLRDGDIVRLERVKPNVLEFIHAVRGQVHSVRDKALGQLSDQGHIVLSKTALVETRPKSRAVCFTFWVKICIRRESVELVSKRIFRENFFMVFLEVRPGGLHNEDDVFREVFRKWKTSKQFHMESSKASSGAGLIPPADVFKLELYEHQKQGLRWMVDREELPADEDDEELSPFWEKKDELYRSQMTGFITFKRPQKIRGGILADESGMGKTLTLLSLIAYTKHPPCRNNYALASDVVSEQHYLRGCENMSKSTTVISHVRKKQKVVNLPDEDVNFEWRPTLIVCPPSVLAKWKEQIEQCTWPGSLKVCTYSGKNKIRDLNFLRQHDLVLTTYNIVKKEESDSVNSSVLSRIEWWRVVLDDVHVLKCSSSRSTTPFMNLKAKRRWAVTGKPVHEDYRNYNIYPIMAFLQIQPFCDRTEWPMLYGAHPMTNPSLRLEVLMGIFSLRRTMPVKFVEDYLVVLSKDEQDLYDSMAAEAKAAYYNLGLRSVQAAVLHLWQSCNSLALCRLSRAEMVSSKDIQDLSSKPKLLEKWVTVLQEEKDYACPVCMDQPEDIVMTRCTHIFCRSCIMRVFEVRKGKRSKCPLCRGWLSKSDIFSAGRGPSVVEKMKSLMEEESNMSSKVSALLNLLVKSRTEYPNRKSVVFSQFRRMLMLVGGVLSEAGFDVRRMDASDNPKTKAKTVEELSKAEGPVVLLTTFKALSNTPGLDVSAVSNNVYLMEPCLNVHIEEEALGRIHRLGNKDDANVVRLVSKNTIEEKVMEMRQKKRAAYGTRNSKWEINMTRLDDIKPLLSL